MTQLSHSTMLAIGFFAIVLVAAGMIAFELNVSDLDAGIYLENGNLSDAQKESMSVMLELQTLLMNWSIVTIGAMGFFLKLNVEKNMRLRSLDLLLSFLVIILSVISLFFGHLVVDLSAELLSLDQFPVNDETIRNLGFYQYVTGLGAISLFGFHVFQFFSARISSSST